MEIKFKAFEIYKGLQDALKKVLNPGMPVSESTYLSSDGDTNKK